MNYFCCWRLTNYLHHLSEREGTVSLGTALSLCVCPPSRLDHVSTARRISLGGKDNALYPVLSRL